MRAWAALLALWLVLRTAAGQVPNLPGIRDKGFIRECVQVHNNLRGGVQPSASNMRYMSWDAALARTARAWAKRCVFEHNTYLSQERQGHPNFSSIGENLWAGTYQVFNVSSAIKSWYDEVGSYNFATQKCTKVCGHYLQVVWAASYKVGCAVHFCPSVGYSSITNAAHFVCNYGPAGNYPRQPYEMGAACRGCGGEPCAKQLCRNADRDKVVSDSGWHPDWDRPAWDQYCVSTVVLRLLLLALTILATWLLPKHWSVAPVTE
ncbi:glioma pathogenesis-related protein 1-like isoform X2 [Melanerpes formicivorus]|uniref:glioma pathogenesis-related protein 1-like isoform X2 n=1 Tax=Melanerpes formicivorus TaxID=211600 RepID=UPI00358FB39B